MHIMLDSLQEISGAVVQVALDGLAQRQRVIANNIANANSAGFSAQRMDFESALQAAAADALAGTADTQDRWRQVGAAIEAGAYIHGADNPTVQLDLEMAKMNETVIKYQALIQGLNQSNSLVQMAISGNGNQ
jgi:flagellar basal-body rod protein FlgB